jgi:hypothetical protein
MIIESTEKERMIKVMTKEIAIHNLYALKLRSKALSDRDALDMAIKVLEQTRWIPVGERLPMCEQEVLICAERRSINGKIKTIITTAIYEDGTMLENKSKWDWTDIDWERWDEEEDCGVIPEGWWEYHHYYSEEVYNNLVDDFVVKWMPLPEAYTESKVDVQ